jgi:hypothetical protein
LSITFLASLYVVTENPGSVQKIPHPIFCQADLCNFPGFFPGRARADARVSLFMKTCASPVRSTPDFNPANCFPAVGAPRAEQPGQAETGRNHRLKPFAIYPILPGSLPISIRYQYGINTDEIRIDSVLIPY